MLSTSKSNKIVPKCGVIMPSANGKFVVAELPAGEWHRESNSSSSSGLCGLFKRCLRREQSQKWSKQRQSFRARSHSKGSVRKKDFEGTFCEHTWDIHQLQNYFKDSRIDEKHPKNSQGLPWVQAQLQQKGANVLPKPKEIGKWELLLRQFWNMLWALLIGASCLSLLQFFLDTSELVNLWITLILFAMILVMCVCSWLQEMKARQVVRGFQRLLPPCCWVVRDSKESAINAPDLLVGDIVRLRSGQRVPADLRLLHCVQLKLEASSITGESEPVEYRAEEVGERVSVFEAKNVAFNGSLCVEGEALGVVIRIGENTVIGQTAKLTTHTRPNESRLEMQIRKYVKFLIVMACSVAAIVFVVGGFVHQWTNMVQLLANGFLVCAIGMVPCGLPATVTSILTLIARRLASRKVYVKRLDICEALGQVSIIASDKTGTLTKNQMTVTGLWHWDQFVSGFPRSAPVRKYTDEGEYLHGSGPPKGVARYGQPVDEMLACMAICNTAMLGTGVESGEKEQDNEEQQGTVTKLKAIVWGQTSSTGGGGEDQQQQQRGDSQRFSKIEKGRPSLRKNKEREEGRGGAVTIGTPSEVAMLNYANALTDVDKARLDHEDIAFEIPFNSKRKWHLKIVRMGVRGAEADYKMFMKGASEVLAGKCTKILTAEGEREFGQGDGLDKLEAAYTKFAGEGHRVIGFASTMFTAPVDIEFDPEAGNFPQQGLTFLGACAIMDPPRDETAEAIRQCKTAGIKVFMVTGDHHLTACSIARQIGLIEEHQNREQSGLHLCNGENLVGGGAYAVVHGQDISRLSEREWDELVLRKRSVVFARTTPEQKLLIVEQCQRRGQIMAMTGDGVNDAPALKKAHIGIAMGSGSEVAKQAADIVLMDDNFSSIVRAVEEGRVMYENIKKLLSYTMPHSFPEVWPIIINFCFGMPVGITALQILSIDLGTEIFPGVSLSKEPAEGDVMSRPPRAPGKQLISNSLLAYSYIYTGQIQSLGCFLAYCCVFWFHGIAIGDLWMSALKCWQKDGDIFYSNGLAFSVAEQLAIGRQATSAWQMGIVFGQFFNIWSARTRRASLFRHGFFSNQSLLFALLIELLLINCYVYVPVLNEFLGGGPIPWQCWAVVAAVGLFVNLYNEVRKWFIRHFPRNPIVRLFKW